MFVRRGQGRSRPHPELYLAGHKEEATPRCRTNDCEVSWDHRRLKERLRASEDSGANNSPSPGWDAAVDLMAELARLNPPRD